MSIFGEIGKIVNEFIGIPNVPKIVKDLIPGVGNNDGDDNEDEDREKPKKINIVKIIKNKNFYINRDRSAEYFLLVSVLLAANIYDKRI